jgi:hypothetical protein
MFVFLCYLPPAPCVIVTPYLLVPTPHTWLVLPVCVCACACRDRVQPLLRSLCSGVSDPELVPAVSGLLAGSAAVRATALSALPHVPTLAEGVAPESAEVTAVLALARHDVNEDNAAAADTLWQQVGVFGFRDCVVGFWDCVVWNVLVCRSP